MRTYMGANGKIGISKKDVLCYNLKKGDLVYVTVRKLEDAKHTKFITLLNEKKEESIARARVLYGAISKKNDNKVSPESTLTQDTPKN